MKNYFILILILVITLSCKKGKKEDGSASEKTPEISDVTLEEKWSTDTLFQVPESVCYDESRNIIYVSNIAGDPQEMDGDGFISKLSPDGTILQLKWIENLNAPKGMGVFKNFLYVADISKVVVINIEESNVVENYDIPGASFLNDISIDENGMVYISDSEKTTIHVIRNGVVELWMEGSPLNGPNGLYCENDGIMVASSGDEQFKKIQKNNKEVLVIATEIGYGDGVAKDSSGNYLVSSWLGQVFYILPGGEKIELLNTMDEEINSADIDLIVRQNLLLVPTFFDNRVVAYEVKIERMTSSNP
jgi:sugar lactone lactonase YvrE